MKKKNLISIFLLFVSLDLTAQYTAFNSSYASKPMSSLVSLDIQAPVGVFARSHFVGGGLNYSWSHRRYGAGVKPKKWAGLTFNAGSDYYLGKKIKPAGYSFKFDNYLYFYAMAGLIVNPSPMTSISLTGGPTMGVYDGTSNAGMGVNLVGMYYLKSNIAIGGGVSYKKHSQEDALWSCFASFSYAF